MDLGELLYYIRANTDELYGDLEKSEEIVEDSGNRVTENLNQQMNVALGIMIEKGFQQVANFIEGTANKLITLGSDAEDIMVLFETTIKATGHEADGTSEKLQNMANQFSKTTMFEDEALLKAGTTLLRFKDISTESYEAVMKVAMDMSAATGKSIETVTKQLAIALSNPTNATRVLRQAGVVLTETEKDMVKSMMEVNDIASAQAFIMGKLDGAFKGAAEAMSGTYSGSLQRFQNTLGNIYETLATPLLDRAKEWLNFLTDSVLPILQQLADEFAKAPKPIQDFVLALGGLILVAKELAPVIVTLNALKGLLGFGAAAAGAGAAGGAATTVAKTGILATIGAWLAKIPALLAGAGTAIGTFFAGLGVSMEGLTLAASSVLTGLVAPLAIILTAIIGFKLAWDNNFLGMRDGLQAFGEAMQKLPLVLSIVIPKIGEWLSNLWTQFTDWMAGVWKGIGDWWSSVWESLNGWFEELKKTWEQLWKDITDFLFGWMQWDWGQIGYNIVIGIWNGIAGAWDWFVGSVEEAFNNLIKGIGNTLGIHSPSTVFAEMGKNMAAGLQQGFSDNLGGQTLNINRKITDTFGGTGVSGKSIQIGKIEYHGSFSQEEMERLDRRSKNIASNTLMEAMGS